MSVVPASLDQCVKELGANGAYFDGLISWFDGQIASAPVGSPIQPLLLQSHKYVEDSLGSIADNIINCASQLTALLHAQSEELDSVCLRLNSAATRLTQGDTLVSAAFTRQLTGQRVIPKRRMKLRVLTGDELPVLARPKAKYLHAKIDLTYLEHIGLTGHMDPVPPTMSRMNSTLPGVGIGQPASPRSATSNNIPSAIMEVPTPTHSSTVASPLSGAAPPLLSHARAPSFFPSQLGGGAGDAPPSLSLFKQNSGYDGGSYGGQQPTTPVAHQQNNNPPPPAMSHHTSPSVGAFANTQPPPPATPPALVPRPAKGSFAHSPTTVGAPMPADYTIPQGGPRLSITGPPPPAMPTGPRMSISGPPPAISQPPPVNHVHPPLSSFTQPPPPAPYHATQPPPPAPYANTQPPPPSFAPPPAAPYANVQPPPPMMKQPPPPMAPMAPPAPPAPPAAPMAPPAPPSAPMAPPAAPSAPKAAPKAGGGGGGGAPNRGALLASIQAGTGLRKVAKPVEKNEFAKQQGGEAGAASAPAPKPRGGPMSMADEMAARLAKRK